LTREAGAAGTGAAGVGAPVAGTGAGIGAGVSGEEVLSAGLFVADGGESGAKDGLLLGGLVPPAVGASGFGSFDSNNIGAGLGLAPSTFFGSDTPPPNLGAGDIVPAPGGVSGEGLGGDSGDIPPSGAGGDGGATGGVGGAVVGFGVGPEGNDSNGMPVPPMLGVGAGAEGTEDGFGGNGLPAGGDNSGTPTGGETGFTAGLGLGLGGDSFGSGLPCFSFRTGGGEEPLGPSNPPIMRMEGSCCDFTAEFVVAVEPLRLSAPLGPLLVAGATFAFCNFSLLGPLLSFLSGISVFSGAVDVRTILPPPKGGEDLLLSASPGGKLGGDCFDGLYGSNSWNEEGFTGGAGGGDRRVSFGSLPSRGFDTLGALSPGDT